MKQKTLAIMLMVVIIGVAICAAIVYAYIVPHFGLELATSGKGVISPKYLPWLVFTSLTAIPVAIVLIMSFIISVNISRNRSFCMENARLLAIISILAAVGTFYFFAGNVVFVIVKMHNGGFFVLNMLVCFAGFAMSVAAAALSHYARKAAALKEQADLTI